MKIVFNKSQSRRQFVRHTLLSAGGLLLTSAAGAVDQAERAGLDTGELGKTLDAFGKSVQGRVLLASDADYDGVRRVLSFNPQTDKYPAIIAQCKTAEDVARSIEFARASSLEIAVKSGGCDVMGQSVCEGGMLIDLSSLQEIELSAEERTVRVGAGVRCGAFEYQVQPFLTGYAPHN